MARYTKDENGNLILTAGGTRTWIVTQAAHDRAVSAGTAPNNCLVAITDDYPTEDESGTMTKTSLLNRVFDAHWARKGNVVTLSLDFELASAAASGNVMLTGAPKPTNRMLISMSAYGSTNISALFEITTDGNVVYNGVGSISSGVILGGSVTYFTD